MARIWACFASGRCSIEVFIATENYPPTFREARGGAVFWSVRAAMDWVGSGGGIGKWLRSCASTSVARASSSAASGVVSGASQRLSMRSRAFLWLASSTMGSIMTTSGGEAFEAFIATGASLPREAGR